MTPTELSAWLAKHKLQPWDLAKLLGVTDQAVQHWLGNRRSIPLTTVRLLKIFDKYPSLMKEF